MAFNIIQSFIINKSAPVDAKQDVADSTARLALVYPYKGLVVKQADTGQLYRYITTTPGDGSVPSNISGDWELVPTVFTGSGAPANGKGVIGDIWIDETGYVIYKKTGSAAWTALFSISGSQITTGVGVPAGGNNGDLYVRSDGGVYTKAAGTWTLQFNIKGTNGTSDKFASVSTTSVDVSTAVAPLIITIGTGLSWTVGQGAIMASRSTPTRFITGTVTAYNSGTGSITLNPITPAGAAGAKADWDFNLQGAAGQIGKAFIHTEADINFNDAKVTAVQAGTYTKADPWTASIGNDTRSSLAAPVTLIGSMTGHSIAYDGTTWIDNGRWLGFKGDKGDQGDSIKGDKGDDGDPGTFPFSALNPVTDNGSILFGIHNILNNPITMGIGSAPPGTMIFVSNSGGSPGTGNYIYTSSPTAQIFYRGVPLDPFESLDLSGLGIISCVLISNGVAWQVVGEVSDQSSFLSQIKPSSAPNFTSTADLSIDASTISTISYPSFTFVSNAYTVPRFDFIFGAFRNGGGDIDITGYIEASDDNISFYNLKSTKFRLTQNIVSYFKISVLDNTAIATVTRYYRLTVIGSATFRPSTNNDHLSHGVLRYL